MPRPWRRVSSKPPMNRWRVAVTLVALAALSVAAEAATVRIEMSDVAFAPATMSVKRGDTVEWSNTDIVDHTATARDGAFEIVLAPGQKKRMKVSKAGGHDYYCRYHPNRIGRLDVSEETCGAARRRHEILNQRLNCLMSEREPSWKMICADTERVVGATFMYGLKLPGSACGFFSSQGGSDST
jgi:plastocyanin